MLPADSGFKNLLDAVIMQENSLLGEFFNLCLVSEHIALHFGKLRCDLTFIEIQNKFINIDKIIIAF